MALGREADEETLDQSELRVWLDMSSKFTQVIIDCISPNNKIIIHIYYYYRSTSRPNISQRYPIFIQRFCQRSFKIL